MNNIFDLEDTKDVTESLASELSVNKKDDFEIRILKLFNIAKEQNIFELSLDQIAVGYDRKFKIEEVKSRKQIALKIYTIANSTNPDIEAVPRRKGIYKLRENENTYEDNLDWDDDPSTDDDF